MVFSSKNRPRYTNTLKSYLQCSCLFVLMLMPLFSLAIAQVVSAQGVKDYTYADQDNSEVYGPPFGSLAGKATYTRTTTEGCYVANGGTSRYIQTKNGKWGGKEAFLADGFCQASGQEITINSYAGNVRGSWKSHSVIEVDGKFYIDPKIDDNLSYKISNSDNECQGRNYIDGFPDGSDGTSQENAKRAKIHLFEVVDPQTNKNCNETIRNITFSDQGNFEVYFWWQDQGNIVTADGGDKTIKGGEPGIRFKNTDPNLNARNIYTSSGGRSDDDDCKSTISATPGEPTGKLIIRNSSSSSPLNEGWPGAINNELQNEGGGCYASKEIDILIGNVNAGKTIPPGDGVDTVASADDPEADCESSGVLGWILCPVVANLYGAANSIAQDFVLPLLEVNALDTQNNQLYDIWKNFRTIANVVFVLVFFVIIFSTAINNRE